MITPIGEVTHGSGVIDNNDTGEVSAACTP